MCMTEEGDEMTGKKYFYWLGKLHGTMRVSERRYIDKSSWTAWAHRSYTKGWYVGFLESSI